jgi:DNA-binding MarR family transcriptional regulator
LARDFDIQKIDRIIHGRIRLGVMAYLMIEDPAEFGTLRNRLEANDGTLSVHLRKLEEAGYVAIEKTYKGRRPLTRIHLTANGRTAFAEYLAAMEELVRLAQG